MKRWLLFLTIFAIAAVALVGQHGRGQPGDGPGTGGATLRYPGMEATPKPAVPEFARGGVMSAAPFAEYPTKQPERVALPPSNAIDINKDIQITDKQSPWIIFLMAYSGPEAPKLAREFVDEMRTNFKLNAYVFNYGADEKRKEYERVQKLRNDQADALKNLPFKTDVLPMRVRTMKIEEQTGVLIDGGYRSRDEALAGLKKLRSLRLDQPPYKGFEDRVKLDMKIAIKEQADNSVKSGVRVDKDGIEAVFISPFSRAFPARNPAIKTEQAAQAPIDSKDLELLRILNDGEPLSLFKSKKAFTLVIKQYNTQSVIVRNKKEEESFLEKFPKVFNLSKREEDIAANHAHNLAEAFRKSGFSETYVLHSRYSSFVTIGGYDSIEDKEMLRMQDHLESRFQADAYRPIALLPRPTPMAVPR